MTLPVYATIEQYRIRQRDAADDAGETGIDDMITEQLFAMSRLIDKELGIIPGAFGPHDATYKFDVYGGDYLELIADERVHWMRSIDAGGLQFNDGVDRAWDLSDAWLQALPLNAAAYGEPYSSIRIDASSFTAPAANWPTNSVIKIAGSWGWGETPGTIRELTIGMTRDTRDAEVGGAAAAVQYLDDGTPLASETAKLWGRIKREYSTKLPFASAPTSRSPGVYQGYGIR